MRELSELKPGVRTISESAFGLGLCLLQLNAVIFLMTHCLPSWQNKIIYQEAPGITAVLINIFMRRGAV